MDAHKEVGSPYGIQGFPTLKFFGFDKKSPQDYSGQRDADSIINYGLEKSSSEVKKRMSKGGASSEKKPQQEKKSKPADSGSKSSGSSSD
jgi:protein disulfide-isomerase A6